MLPKKLISKKFEKKFLIIKIINKFSIKNTPPNNGTGIL
jgi:hypothetical protein